jgi:hypothetical protein
MTDKNKTSRPQEQQEQQDQLDHVSGGGHLGGTNFGQQPGDANLKPGRDSDQKGGKRSPDSGKAS